jgi:sec-independent protein translocase protein TatA
LVIFGPGKLPKVGESLGKAMQSFKKAKDGDEEESEDKKKV